MRLNSFSNGSSSWGAAGLNLSPVQGCAVILCVSVPHGCLTPSCWDGAEAAAQLDGAVHQHQAHRDLSRPVGLWDEPVPFSPAHEVLLKSSTPARAKQPFRASSFRLPLVATGPPPPLPLLQSQAFKELAFLFYFILHSLLKR